LTVGQTHNPTLERLKGSILQQLWRWFGQNDNVTLDDIRQSGAQGLVTSLHHLPAGTLCSRNAIANRQHQIASSPGPLLSWDVVESLLVSEAIKAQSGEWRAHLATYMRSMEALGAQGIHTICYNFMPVLDWTRTVLHHRRPHGGTAMRFDLVTFAMFDLQILGRDGSGDYTAEVRADAARLLESTDNTARAALVGTITRGLPGAVDRWSLDELRACMARYVEISADRMRAHHVDFLSEIAPLAERLDLRLCCDPDDPPFPILVLPRVVSTVADYRHSLSAVDSPAVGMMLCTGSLGARADNNCAAMAREFGSRIHIVHLRKVRRDSEDVPCSFFEDEHLGGEVDMVEVIGALLDEEARRRSEGCADSDIPLRPGHGLAILSDLLVESQPGYPAVGRLKGLAELRGDITALSHRLNMVPQ
jgi:mannonate dehydratase